MKLNREAVFLLYTDDGEYVDHRAVRIGEDENPAFSWEEPPQGFFHGDDLYIRVCTTDLMVSQVPVGHNPTTREVFETGQPLIRVFVYVNVDLTLGQEQLQGKWYWDSHKLSETLEGFLRGYADLKAGFEEAANPHVEKVNIMRDVVFSSEDGGYVDVDGNPLDFDKPVLTDGDDD